jgi:pimeloyl-ACP methyl ester carboxylesterase
VLAAWGAISNSGPLLVEMMRGLAEDVTGVEVTGAGHWVPEENPRLLVDSLVQFLEYPD